MTNDDLHALRRLKSWFDGYRAAGRPAPYGELGALHRAIDEAERVPAPPAPPAPVPLDPDLAAYMAPDPKAVGAAVVHEAERREEARYEAYRNGLVEMFDPPPFMAPRETGDWGLDRSKPLARERAAKDAPFVGIDEAYRNAGAPGYEPPDGAFGGDDGADL